jgi:predicted DCC family thiol-disulfide oxidoreductase YuxK
MKLTVWFDSGCPLCLREIALMRRLDRAGAIRFTDILSEASACPVDPAVMLKRFHAQENGVLLSGAAAFAAMWRAIPVLRPLGLAARHPWVLAGLERLYVFFLRHRPRLQRWVKQMERSET